jgi:hypothetical protein
MAKALKKRPSANCWKKPGCRSRTWVAERNFTMMLPSGETVLSVERYFVVHAAGEALTRDGWTVDEVRVMTEHKWWSVAELQQTAETVWPERLIEMVENA